MKRNLADRLREKGWTKAEIKKTLKILLDAEKKKSKKVKMFDLIIYWAVLIISIFGNAVISVALVPFLLELRDILLYIVIILLGLVFGALFDLLIRDIESIEQKHVIVAGLFIPSLAIVNIFYATKFANIVALNLKININHNPLIIALIYVAAFILPHLISRIVNQDVYY